MDKVFEVLHMFGDFVSYELDPEKLVGDLQTVRNSDYISALVPGVCFGLDTKGFVLNLSGAGDESSRKFAFVTLLASGYDWENNPAIASGKITGLTGGGIVRTNNIKDATVTVGAPLYAGADGVMTTSEPGSGFKGVVGYALSARTDVNDLVLVQVL